MKFRSSFAVAAVLLGASAFSQGFLMRWARSEGASGYASIAYTDIIAHPNGNFLILGEAQGIIGNRSTNRVYASMIRPDGTRVWTQFFFGLGSTFGAWAPKARILSGGTIGLVAQGQNSGFYKRLNPDTGDVVFDHIALAPNSDVVGADINQDGQAFFSYWEEADQVLFSDSIVAEDGFTYYRRGTRYAVAHSIERVDFGGATSVWTFKQPRYRSEVGDLSGTVRYGSDYLTQDNLSTKFMFRFNGEPFFSQIGLLEDWTFLGSSAVGGEQARVLNGRSLQMGRLSKTLPPIFSYNFDLLDTVPEYYMPLSSGLQPDHDLNIQYNAVNGMGTTRQSYQYRYNGAFGGADPIASELNYDKEEFMNGFFYRSTDGGFLSEGKGIGKWAASSATPVWGLSGLEGFSRQPWQTITSALFVDGGVPKTQLSRWRDSDGSLLDTTNFTVRPNAGSTGLAMRASDGATFLVGKSVLGGGRYAGWIARYDQAPQAFGENFTVPRNGTLNGPSVLANDRMGAGIVPVIVRNPFKGTVTMNANGTFTYRPFAGYSGSDSFQYRLIRAGVTQSTATVGITVTP